MIAVWIWSFAREVTPEQAAVATEQAGLDDTWIPAVSFAEVAQRAVGDLRAKRTKEPGVILWTVRGKRFFADLVAGRFEFESPRSAAAKHVKARLDAARHLLPRDLDAYMEARAVDHGAVHLMGPLWLVPDGLERLVALVRQLPGAAVAAVPVAGDPRVAGEVLALLAGRLQAASEDLTAGLDGLKPETLRRRASVLRGHAEDVAQLAGLFGIDLTAIGNLLVEAEGEIRGRLKGSHYSRPLDFGGESAAQPEPETVEPAAPRRRRVHRLVAPGESGVIPRAGRPGDPPSSVPPLRAAREAEET